MALNRALSVVVCLVAALSAAAPKAAAQDTVTFVALGSDADEVVGHGSDIYFDETTAEFFVNRTSGVHRDFISIIIRPRDGSAWWSMGFSTPEHGLGLPLVGATHYATETPGYASAEIGVTAAGASCGRRIGSFTIRELRLALPAPVGFGVALEFGARCAGATGGLHGQVRIYSTLTGTTVGDLGMSALSPVAPGTPLRFAVDLDSSVPLEFKFIRYQVSTGRWTVIQDYSFRPVWSWTPTIGDLDDYYLQVWIRARGSTNPYDTYRSLGPFTIRLSLASIVSLTSSASSPIAPGTTITWTAAAHGGMARLEYQFIKYSAARARWEIVREWSADPVWVETTTPADQGENIVVVAVKSWGGDSLEATQEAHSVVAPPEESYVLASRPPAEGLPGGQQVLFNSRTYGYVEAVASDDLEVTARRGLPDTYVSASMRGPDGGVPGVGLYENAEFRYSDRVAGIPSLDLNMSAVSPCPTPATRKFRIFELEYDGGRTAARVAVDIEQVCADARSTIFVAVRINSTLPLFNMFPVTSNVPSTVGPGTPVTWTADASSGTGPVEYRFLHYSAERNSWTIVRDWSTDRRFTWTPSTSDYGAHLVQVWARTVGSAVAYEDWRNSEQVVVIPSAPRVYGLYWDAPRPRAGQPVTLEAVAGGGSGVLEYRFVQFEYAIGRWSVIREYASSNRAVWTPPAGSSGEYAIQVWVREVGSTADYDAWAGTPFTLEPARLLIISGRAGDPVSGGRSVSLPLSSTDPGPHWMYIGAINGEASWSAGFEVQPASGWATEAFEVDTAGPLFAPRFGVGHGSSSCPAMTGRFTINELELGPDRIPSRLSIDFEQQCGGAAEPLYGGLRYNSNVPLVSALSVTPSTASPAAGSPVTFTAIGSSATGPVEYRFFVLREETGQWSLVREYGAANTVTWTPPAPGTYLTQLWVRRRGSTASYESYVNGAPLTVR
jgi:hypothetical protein